MIVIRAEEMGFCFGVRQALDTTRRIAKPAEVTINGELVHNQVILAELSERGFRRTKEGDRSATPSTHKVLITAHGVSDATRRRLEQAGHSLIDTTCPLVRRAQVAAAELRDAGFFPVIIGRRDHVEVLGITEDCPTFDVVESVAQVRHYDEPKIGVLCQTTTAPAEAAAILNEIRRHNPHSEIQFMDTICASTRARQLAAERLLTRVEMLVVVGGRNSNNTRRLVDLARDRRKSVHHVEDAAGLDPTRLNGHRVVGLIAGTSTPDEVIEEVHRRLVALNPVAATGFTARRVRGADDDIRNRSLLLDLLTIGLSFIMNLAGKRRVQASIFARAVK